MAYLGIGYRGTDTFLKKMVDSNSAWLRGDRTPRFFGDNFLVLYDSNTAREFASRCLKAAPENAIAIYPMDRPIEQQTEHNYND
jgi:hypothetical protein